MLFKFILYTILGYIIIKSVRVLVNIFTAGKAEEKVYTTSKTKPKIDKKDVIDAEFEEIDIKSKNSDEN